MQKCTCGKEMSEFEEKKYGTCGFCAEKVQKTYLLEQKAERERVAEEHRVAQEEKKQQEIRENARIKEENRQKFRDKLLTLKGKTVSDVWVQDWEPIQGVEAPNAIVITFTDDSQVTFEREHYSDGCRGHYDHYYYLDFSII